MIGFKKAVFALGLDLGMAASMNSWAAPGCDTCQWWGDECMAGDQGKCDDFYRLGCTWYGRPGQISCDI